MLTRRAYAACNGSRVTMAVIHAHPRHLRERVNKLFAAGPLLFTLSQITRVESIIDPH